MSPSESDPPPVDEGSALHERLVAGDPTAPADLASTYLDRLIGWLFRHNPGVDPHICATAAEDALLALIKSPASYRREKQSLEGYLRMSASGDLKNLLRSERRHARRRTTLEAVELSLAAGKYLWDEDSDPARIIGQADDERQSPLLSGVQETLTREESQVLELMLEGERRTEVYAAVLGLTNRPILEQRREVKRVKDRLKKRLERAGGRRE